MMKKLALGFVMMFLSFSVLAAEDFCLTRVVPGYIYVAPGGVALDWVKFQNNHLPGDMWIANPAHGPGTAVNADLKIRTDAMKASGVKLIGYIDTDYTVTCMNQVWTKMRQWKNWYGVDGFFFDQVSSVDNQTTPSSNPDTVAYYNAIVEYAIKLLGTDAIVILNHGTNPEQAFADIDPPAAGKLIHVTYEGTLANYTAQADAGWMASYAETRFMHLVYAASYANRATTLASIAGKNAKYFYQTHDAAPNQWDVLATSNTYDIQNSMCP